MGSLTSRPKVPETVEPQVVYVSAPAPSPSTSPEIIVNENSDEGSAGGNDNADTPVSSNADTEIRITNLLRRNRGLSGTIQTGFRGLLSANGLIPQRKTLLGE